MRARDDRGNQLRSNGNLPAGLVQRRHLAQLKAGEPRNCHGPPRSTVDIVSRPRYFSVTCSSSAQGPSHVRAVEASVVAKSSSCHK